MLASLIASIVSGEASDAVGRTRRAVLAYALAGLLALCGAGFLLGAAYVAAAREIGAVAAALWFGGGFLLAAMLVVAIHRIASRAKARRAAARRQSEVKAVASAAALAMLPTLLAGRGRSLALIAPAVAALAWAVWRENAPRRDTPKDGPD